MGVAANSCPACGRAITVHDFALNPDDATSKKQSRDGAIGVVVCFAIAVAVSLGAAAGQVPQIVAILAWMLAVVSLGPRMWWVLRGRHSIGGAPYRRELEDGWSMEKGPTQRDRR